MDEFTTEVLTSLRDNQWVDTQKDLEYFIILLRKKFKYNLYDSIEIVSSDEESTEEEETEEDKEFIDDDDDYVPDDNTDTDEDYTLEEQEEGLFSMKFESP
jgi:hypothetical protein|tara:strand:- start:133 stop:435 length:303 start_codon:yes stop_codon:yes gene_type:complete